MKRDRLSNRQIATLKQLAVCSAHGGKVSLRADQREAMTPLWRRGLVEIWFCIVPDEGSRGPFYRLAQSGRILAATIMDSINGPRAAA